MKIALRRVGGIAAVQHPATLLDTDNLAPDEQSRFRDLVRAARFFDLPREFPHDESVRDGTSIVLEVSDDERQHSVAFGLGGAPDALRALVSAVRATKTRP